MALPARIAKKAKRDSRWRSPAHCNFVRSHACSVCGSTTAIEVAHVRIGSGAGMGQKPDDWNTISLCGGLSGHHAEQHRIGERSFEQKYKISMTRLADEFAAASPKAFDIRMARRG